VRIGISICLGSYLGNIDNISEAGTVAGPTCAATVTTFPGEITNWILGFFAQNGTTIATGVSAWANRGSLGGSLAQATGADQPLVATADVNGWDALSFDGSNDALAMSFSAQNGPVTKAMVFKITGSVTLGVHDGLWDGNSFASQFALIDSTTPRTLFTADGGTHTLVHSGVIGNGAYAYIILVEGTSASLDVNGTQTDTGNTAAASSWSGLILAALGGNTRNIPIKIAEYHCWVGDKTSDRQKIRDYLHAKYGL
jgi:hypothetical protein